MSRTPASGPEIDRLLKVLELSHGVVEESARLEKVAEAQRILARGPGAEASDGEANSIGIAIGFVQSGKTMSFTTLAALAADNGYRVVVMILGNTHLLVSQNTKRLSDDLGIEQREDWRWAHLPMPKRTTNLDQLLAQDDRVILITVLKHTARLNAIAEIFERSSLIGGAPVLIIDDEADQASLNAGVKKGRTTPTYASIRRMRRALRRHLYVQYTATPFAPLLLEPHDGLAPLFAELLQPGAGYTGGRSFFLDHRDTVVRLLTDDEADDKAPTQLPAGLERALNGFLVGTALMRANQRLRGGVSMLIHTSGLKQDHGTIQKLVESHLVATLTRAGLASGDVGKTQWLASLEPLRLDYTAHGVSDVSQEVFEQALLWVARMARVWLVNSSEEGEHPDWALSPVNVLIGGNKLDRGFTVRGLTTTYITRKATGGQADTIEQRARCYGYKRSYLEYCRVYAPENVVDAFTSLVHTEADLRESIAAWQAEGKPLVEWSVENGILLPDDIRPTRPTVLSDTYERGFTGWSFLRHPDRTELATKHNWGLLEELGLTSAGVKSYGDVEIRSTVTPARDVLDRLLTPWRAVGSPGWDAPAILRGLRGLIDSRLVEQIPLLLFARSGGKPRLRTWREPDGYLQLMQGSNEGTRYPGDRRVIDGLQLQVHLVTPRDDEASTLAMALYVPPLAGGLAKVVGRS